MQDGGDAIPDGENARVAMVSARFDGGEVEQKFRRIHRILQAHGYDILMVDATVSEDFGRKTRAFLGKLLQRKGVLLAVCTDHYAEVTSSPYSSYEELSFCYNYRVDIMPLRLSDTWPPEPPYGPDHLYDKEGDAYGLLAMAFPPNKVYLDCRTMDEETCCRFVDMEGPSLPLSLYSATPLNPQRRPILTTSKETIAVEIAKQLQQQRRSSGHGKKARQVDPPP